MNRSTKKILTSTLCLLLGANFLFAQGASASQGCREYYNSYVYGATMPNPPIIIVGPPHYHGHYPVYHAPRDTRHGGGGVHHGDGTVHRGGDDGAAAVFILFVAGLLTTTSIAEDVQLHDTRTMINIIDQAEQGDGPQLRDFAKKVESKMKSSVTLEQVATAVVRENDNYEFCRAGDLDTVRELVARVANDITNSR